MTSQNICKRYRTLLRCSTLILVIFTHYGYASPASPIPFPDSLSLISDGGNGGDGGPGERGLARAGAQQRDRLGTGRPELPGGVPELAGARVGRDRAGPGHRVGTGG